ncbi:M4 family metallopeptidase [Candidatus Sumerlaeota bacterium]|nr:M4 family metallopeptidase [Candidatus Sumerlaeota bacterium]
MAPDESRGGRSLGKTLPGQTPEAVAREFVRSRKDVLAIDDADADLMLERVEYGNDGSAHLFFTQQLHGIPFWGRQIAAHFDKTGSLESLSCLISTDANTKVAARGATALIPAASAVAAVQKQMVHDGVQIESLASLKASPLKYEGATAVLHYWQREIGDATHLVWVVEDRPNIRDWYRFFVDATSGEILEYYNNTQSDGPATANATNLLGQSKTLRTYQVGSTYYLIDTTRPMFQSGQTSSQLIQNPQGSIVTLDLRNEPANSSSQIFHVTSNNNSWSDRTSVSAHDYGAVAYEYFRTTQNRNSLDGSGGSILSIVHLDQNLDNAYWNGQFMLYGDGGSLFNALARGLDVAAHEMTHGVTQHSANLEYKNQSGALNESFSDVFGMMVDSDDYRMGEDVVKPSSFPSGALRDLQNPHNGGSGMEDNGWQPAHMNEFVQLSLSQDNGGVHVNSGIPNKAAYNLTNALGRTKAGSIYYKALTTKLLKQSNFADCRKALEDVAIADYGNNSTEHNAVKNAFANVGIGSAGTSTPPPDDPAPSGSDQYFGVGEDNRLYYSNDGTTYSELRPEIINAFVGGQFDTGSAKPYTIDPVTGDAFFVGADHNIYFAPITGSGGLIANTSGFASISFSPSGRKLALTVFSSVKDNRIVIIDLGVEPSVSLTYSVYHPTTAAGVYDDTIYRIDALEWIDDQLLIFDCFNSSGTGDGARQYWDINILDTNSPPGSPLVYPLLAAQPDSVDVGNPVVSTLNGTIICFDYLDYSLPVNQKSYVWSANLYTGQINANFITVGNDFAAVCDYAPDDSMIYLSRGTASDGYDAYGASLTSDRMSVTGNFQTALTDGGYFNHFAKRGSSISKGNLINYLLGYPQTPETVDFNDDARSDAADVADFPTK